MARKLLHSRNDLAASLMGLQVHSAGRDMKRPGCDSKTARRTLNTFAVVYLGGGSGLFNSAATKRCEIRRGSLFFLFPGVWHLYGPRRSEAWQEYWFLFEGFIPDRFRRTSLLDPARPIYDVGYDQELIQRWKTCIHISETRPEGWSLLLSERLYSILGHVFANGRAEMAEDSRATLVSAAIELMEDHISDPAFSLEDHSGDLGMCYSGLRRLFKSRTGYSPAKYLARIKMQIARPRLLTTDDSVKAIAMDLGFEDPYHFSRRFKQLTGLAPQDYREAFRGQD